MDSKLCDCGCGQAAPIATHRDARYGSVRGEPRRFIQGHGKRTVTLERDDLVQLYVDQKLTYRAIGEMYGVSLSCIARWIKRYGIRTRSLSESIHIAAARRRPPPCRDELIELYCDRLMHPKDIGVMYGVNNSTVRQWLKKSSIPTRNISQAKRIDADRIKPPDEELQRLYIEENWSGSDFARHLGVNRSTAIRWLKSAGVPIRSSSEQSKINRAKMPLKPIKNREVRAGRRYEVLARDGFKCCACGRSPKEHDVVLQVDHIQPFSKGGITFIDNLQTLCHDCNLGKSNLEFGQDKTVS